MTMRTQSTSGRREILLWLLNVNLGVALGAGLYEGRVVIPEWTAIPPSSWPNTGTRFWAFVTTGPLTLLTVLNGIAAWRDRSARRTPWLAAVSILACERLATFGYFIPTMIGLMEHSTSTPEVVSRLNGWMTLNYGRHVLTFAAWLLAMGALATHGATEHRPVR
jgi:hypothetical protein